MDKLSPGAVEHLIPVMEVLAATVLALVAIAGGLWSGFRWLRGQIQDSFSNLTRSDDFRRVVSEIISDATSGWNDLNNRMHEEHRFAISDLRKRDDERAEAIKRIHGRVDNLMDKANPR